MVAEELNPTLSSADGTTKVETAPSEA